MTTQPRSSASELLEMEFVRQKLKELVNWVWTYGVVWKIGPDRRTPIWYQGYFNEAMQADVSQQKQFESVYRSYQLTPTRPWYAYLAWHQQAPCWWTGQSEPVLTDENKKLFLTAGIQTLACFPGHSAMDGSGFCVEMASTSLVSDTEMNRNAFQNFIDKSIAPYIFGLAPHSIPTTSTRLLHELAGSLLEDVVQVSPVMAVSESQSGLLRSSTPPAIVMSAELTHENSAILTGITNNTSNGLDEALEAMHYGNIGSSEEPHYSWNIPGSMALYEHLSSDLIAYQEVPNNSTSLLNFDMLGQLQSTDRAELNREDTQQRATQGWAQKQLLTSITTGYPSSNVLGSSLKGKEIVEPEISDFAQQSPQKRLLPRRNTDELGRLASSSSPSVIAEMLRADMETSQAVSSLPNFDTQILPPDWSSVSRSSVKTALEPPWHSPWSAFQAFRSTRFYRSSLPNYPKREPMIHQWVMKALRNWDAQRGRPQSDQNPREGGSGNSDATLGTDFNSRSPNSEAHRQKERTRREKSKRKLDTLISIVPIITKRDKISVLSSTIEYIQKLLSRISVLEKEHEAALGTAGAKEAMTSISNFRTGEELGFNNTEAAAGPSSSSTTPAVVVEGTQEGETLHVIVETVNHPRSLLQLLSILQDLKMGIISVESVCENGRFRAAVCVKNSKKSTMTPYSLQATLCQVLEANPCPD